MASAVPYLPSCSSPSTSSTKYLHIKIFQLFIDPQFIPHVSAQQDLIQGIGREMSGLLSNLEHAMLQCSERNETETLSPMAETYNFLSFQREGAQLKGWCNSNRAVSTQQFTPETDQVGKIISFSPLSLSLSLSLFLLSFSLSAFFLFL